MYVSAVVFAISAARWGLRSETVMMARRESLTDLTAICPASARPIAVSSWFGPPSGA